VLRPKDEVPLLKDAYAAGAAVQPGVYKRGVSGRPVILSEAKDLLSGWEEADPSLRSG
jgi:hypothetical protein